MKSYSIYRETCESGTDFVANSIKTYHWGVMMPMANERLLQIYCEEVTCVPVGNSAQKYGSYLVFCCF